MNEMALKFPSLTIIIISSTIHCFALPRARLASNDGCKAKPSQQKNRKKKKKK